VTHTTGNSEHSSVALLDVALRAAEAGATIIKEGARRRKTLQWEMKGTADFVSEIDRAAEQAIAAKVQELCPQASLVGEEFTPTASSTDGLSFIVDPVDGTTNFLHGYPIYSVSIGVWHGDEGLAGVIINVPTGDTFTAARGQGAFLNGEKIDVSGESDPGRALIGTGFPFRSMDVLELYMRQFAAIARGTAGIRRTGSAALDFADVACGHFEGFWEIGLGPWDAAAGIVIVREAGGVVTHFDGTPARPINGSYIAGNPSIHGWLQGIISNTMQSRSGL
jgi:myo-inositol-1(or 4)-monophosphatase